MDGIINVLKPPGKTSHDVVSFLRRLLNIRQVGHTGTLDPEASGVLPICIGKATKVSEFLTDKTKSYRAELVLGVRTDTQDMTGKILEENKVHISEEELKEAAATFMGEIEQIPPMYSAVKVAGKKLYELARKGIEIERAGRKVNIFNIRIVEFDVYAQKALLDIECSKGTYIRTLCADIGKKIGCGACMGSLVRTRSGEFKIEDSLTLDEISELNRNNRLIDRIVPIDNLFKDYKKANVMDESLKWVLNGAVIYPKDLKEKSDFISGEIIRLYDRSSNFIALYECESNEGRMRFKVYKMFI